MADQLFITSKKTVKINGDGWTHTIPAGYMGPVPPHVVDHWYFDANCRDGVITAIVSVRSDSVPSQTEEQLKANMEKQKADEIRKAKSTAKKLAEDEAAKRGLDEITKKQLIKERQAEAIEEIEKRYTE